MFGKNVLNLGMSGEVFIMFGRKAPSNDALSLLYTAVNNKKFNNPLDVAFLPNTRNTWPGLARSRSAENKSS